MQGILQEGQSTPGRRSPEAGIAYKPSMILALPLSSAWPPSDFSHQVDLDRKNIWGEFSRMEYGSWGGFVS